MKTNLKNILLSLVVLSFAGVACSDGTGHMEDSGDQPVTEDDPTGPVINPAGPTTNPEPNDNDGITQPDNGGGGNDQAGDPAATEPDSADNPAADPADEDAENYTIGAAGVDSAEPVAETNSGGIVTLFANPLSRPTSRWSNFLESLRMPVSGSPAVEVSAPVAPLGLTATAVSPTQINLVWRDNSNNETGFKIQRSTSPSSGFTDIHTTAANTTIYSDTGLTAGTNYYYRVRATNFAGNSVYSNTTHATTLDSARAVEITVYASVDTMMMSSSANPTVASTAYASGENGVGCNWNDSSFIDYYGNYVLNFDYTCAFSAIDFTANISEIDGKRINSAILKLYPRTLPADYNAKIVVSPIAVEWDATITWNDLPDLNLYTDYSEVVDLPVNAATPLEIDVTETVQSWADDSMQIQGFLLHQRDQDFDYPWMTAYRVAAFHSLERYDNLSHRPQLVLDYE